MLDHITVEVTAHWFFPKTGIATKGGSVERNNSAVIILKIVDYSHFSANPVAPPV
jgi:hypothetical protein